MGIKYFVFTLTEWLSGKIMKGVDDLVNMGLT